MKIAVVGSYGVGLTMFSPRFPGAGETVTGGPFLQAHGGKGSNQAIAAARLGASVSFLTAIGNDAYGQSAQQLWRTENIGIRNVKIVDKATMVGVIVVEEGGENRIIIAPGALTGLEPTDVHSFEPQLSGADVALVSLEIPIRTAAEALKVASESGTKTVFNPAPASRLPDTIWPWVDIVTPNETEAAIIVDADPGTHPGDLARQVYDHTRSTVVITAGTSGAFVANGSGLNHVEAVQAPAVVDTTGAGDSFNGALAVGIAAGASLPDAVTLATHAGAHTVSVAGVVPALATLAELQAKGLTWNP